MHPISVPLLGLSQLVASIGLTAQTLISVVVLVGAWLNAVAHSWPLSG